MLACTCSRFAYWFRTTSSLRPDQAWRDNDGGPKLAVLADDDDRLHVVLENLGLLPYFDFVLTSREVCFLC